jgi:hypothetical protein
METLIIHFETNKRATKTETDEQTLVGARDQAQQRVGP